MDINSIDDLERRKKNIETSFETIEEDLKSLQKKGKSKDKISNLLKKLKKELELIENNYKSMKKESHNLQSEKNKSEWDEIMSQLKDRKINYQNKIQDFESKNIGLISDDNRENNDHLNLEVKVDHSKLNVQQLFERGDVAAEQTDNAVNNMMHHANQGLSGMKEINAGLQEQIENLDNIETDLKEIDISLDRAKKQITDMFKMLSQDKIITCLIITIVIIIIAIIIVSACGGDKNKNFNVPHDIFIKSNNGTLTNQGNFFDNKNIIIKHLITYLCLFLL